MKILLVVFFLKKHMWDFVWISQGRRFVFNQQENKQIVNS
jgi:hypothetical protein